MSKWQVKGKNIAGWCFYFSFWINISAIIFAEVLAREIVESSLRVFRDSEYVFVKVALNQNQEKFWCPRARFWVMRTAIILGYSRTIMQSRWDDRSCKALGVPMGGTRVFGGFMFWMSGLFFTFKKQIKIQKIYITTNLGIFSTSHLIAISWWHKGKEESN